MPLIAEVIIPQMFTAFGEDKGYTAGHGGHKYSMGLHHYQYYCEPCNQIFAAAWGLIQGSLNYSERGSYFHCPYCGRKHGDNIAYIKLKEVAPNKIRLTVREYENVVTFEVYSNTVEFHDYLDVQKGTYKEIFRFDIAKQTVLFTAYDNGSKKETIEIGNPYKLDVFSKSILRFFRPNSLANSRQRSELSRILKVLREAVHRKLEKRLGYKIPSMFVSSGQSHGLFLLPIFNMAYRVACPDAPNLPTIYRESISNIKYYWKSKMLKDYNSDFMDEVMRLTRRKKNFVTAMLTVHSLPDKPLVRKAINEDPFGFRFLMEAFKICHNYDNAINLYRGLVKFWSQSWVEDENLYDFLQKMIPIYGETGIVRMIEKAPELQLWDCIRLYKQLNMENKKALKSEKVRLRDLHDWLSLRHQKQEHVNLKFDVPKHIVKRLSMQKDRLKFFLPEESMQLLEAGHELHNCVASYGAAMKDNKKWLVLVANDKGKLAACLEVRGKELVQAKLDRNKPVSADPKLNAEVLDWAKKAGLKINTLDVSVPAAKKATLRAV